MPARCSSGSSERSRGHQTAWLCSLLPYYCQRHCHGLCCCQLHCCFCYCSNCITIHDTTVVTYLTANQLNASTFHTSKGCASRKHYCSAGGCDFSFKHPWVGTWPHGCRIGHLCGGSGSRCISIRRCIRNNLSAGSVPAKQLFSEREIKKETNHYLLLVVDVN